MQKPSISLASLLKRVKAKNLDQDQEAILEVRERFFKAYEPGWRGLFANVGIQNWVNGISCPHRCPCYKFGLQTKIYLMGGNHIIYDPESDSIIRQKPQSLHSFDMDEDDLRNLDIELIREVHDHVHRVVTIESKNGPVKKPRKQKRKK